MTFEQKHFHLLDETKRTIRMADLQISKGDYDEAFRLLNDAAYHLAKIIAIRDEDEQRN
jgi:HEPN domain-containing protein